MLCKNGYVQVITIIDKIYGWDCGGQVYIVFLWEFFHNFTKFEGICDTLLLGSTTPTENEEVITRFSFLQKKVDGKVPTGGVGAAIIADINKQVKEDIPVWENKKYASKPVLCDSDGPIAKFRKHFATFYVDQV